MEKILDTKKKRNYTEEYNLITSILMTTNQIVFIIGQLLPAHLNAKKLLISLADFLLSSPVLYLRFTQI